LAPPTSAPAQTGAPPPTTLEGELAQEKARADDLQGRLTETQADRAAARTRLCRMIRSGNQEPAV
jgi:hypothetical protein